MFVSSITENGLTEETVDIGFITLHLREKSL